MTIDQTREVISGTPRLWLPDWGVIHCSGCGYPILQRLICEVMEEMELAGRAIACEGAICGGFGQFLDIDLHQGAHGRSADVATAIKRLLPQAFVLSVQGDGDCIAIGTESLIHAATRGERITVIMANNGGYGMTGGQMAPTTLLGQVTATTPRGRDAHLHGFPIHVPELLTSLEGVAYSARSAVVSPATFMRTKKYLRAAFQKQLDSAGFGFVEVLSPCPTNWHTTPIESLRWIEEKVIPLFPLGEFKNRETDLRRQDG